MYLFIYRMKIKTKNFNLIFNLLNTHSIYTYVYYFYYYLEKLVFFIIYKLQAKGVELKQKNEMMN
jgi:hypothetical protein